MDQIIVSFGHFFGSFILYGTPNITLTTAGVVDAFVAKYDPTKCIMGPSKPVGREMNRWKC